jgi:hypothetical protein
VQVLLQLEQAQGKKGFSSLPSQELDTIIRRKIVEVDPWEEHEL